MICANDDDVSPGAQTERRGDAGPVRGLLGCVASPAALVVPGEERPFIPEGPERDVRGRADEHTAVTKQVLLSPQWLLVGHLLPFRRD
jgi:hypothetical protein